MAPKEIPASLSKAELLKQLELMKQQNDKLREEVEHPAGDSEDGGVAGDPASSSSALASRKRRHSGPPRGAEEEIRRKRGRPVVMCEHAIPKRHCFVCKNKKPETSPREGQQGATETEGDSKPKRKKPRASLCRHGLEKSSGECVDCYTSLKKSKEARPRCEHGTPKDRCCRCRGTGPQACVHRRRKEECTICQGSQVCEHGRRRYRCLDCKGRGICEHGGQKFRCMKCQGGGICVHGKRRFVCVECGGKGLCEHKAQKGLCMQCPCAAHSVPRFLCTECGGKGPCEHGGWWKVCAQCTEKRALYKAGMRRPRKRCEHGKEKGKCRFCKELANPLETLGVSDDLGGISPAGNARGSSRGGQERGSSTHPPSASASASASAAASGRPERVPQSSSHQPQLPSHAVAPTSVYVVEQMGGIGGGLMQLAPAQEGHPSASESHSGPHSSLVLASVVPIQTQQQGLPPHALPALPHHLLHTAAQGDFMQAEHQQEDFEEEEDEKE
uniref:Uncharacterized protein n=1 Tax=Chromera velia CCMP2878 TaxID=1169474 RepID=A0A0G4G5P3_9ALVE|eukprot:Cvel_20403.t1-p1 / transcript=Cvel_20403.t1 / gene=Cvel_20403 / organism=Chromera_velia_CCMP2878 / gene_product=hypothetical protein / transcript_product=hypothetical protein / location=Cvel_scaffold1827:23474-25633(+) / protein_length=499 / sequence_SO=supercontig / SO=protein_coding / is_pseudo=false